MAYDDSNVFARILRGELPCQKLYESEWALAFHDINPLAPVHVLVIPKGRYRTLAELAGQGSGEEAAGLLRAVAEVVRLLELEEGGYRVLANNGTHAHQEVPHLHFHVFAGAPLGPMLKKLA